MLKHFLRNIVFLVLILVVASLSYSIGAFSASKGSGVALIGSGRISLLENVISTIKKHYIKPIKDDELLIYGGVDGIVKSLRKEPYNDRHSTFLEPASWRNLTAATEGSYTGVGILVGIDPESEIPVIAYVFPETPAERSGLLARDLIVSIDGESTADMVLDEVANRIVGKEGTFVVLSILREGWEEPREFRIKRAKVKIHTVIDEKMLPGNVGYFRVSTFGLKTAEEVRQAIQRLKQKGAKALVIDLRYNPGGLLESAVSVADIFLSEGVIVSVEQKGKERQVFEAHKAEDDEKLPLVLLVNEYSASASEVLAGAIKDNGRGILVGTKTFGKGSVQEVFELDGGKAAIALTVGRYLTPSGHDLNEKPLSPDVDASLEKVAKDFPQVGKKKKELEAHTEIQARLSQEAFEAYFQAQEEMGRRLAESYSKNTLD